LQSVKEFFVSLSPFAADLKSITGVASKWTEIIDPILFIVCTTLFAFKAASIMQISRFLC
jgi:hypothetical protein